MMVVEEGEPGRGTGTLDEAEVGEPGLDMLLMLLLLFVGIC
jgi:hypothetical protein